jgi:hypothetical protein
MAKDKTNPSISRETEEYLNKKFELEGIRLKANIKEEIAKEITSEVHGNTLWVQAGLAFLGLIMVPSALFYIQNSISAAVKQNSQTLAKQFSLGLLENTSRINLLQENTLKKISHLDKTNQNIKEAIQDELLLLKLGNDVDILKKASGFAFPSIKNIIDDLKQASKKPSVYKNRAFPTILTNILNEFIRAHLYFDIQTTFNAFKPIILHEKDMIALLLDYYNRKTLVDNIQNPLEKDKEDQITQKTLLAAAEKFKLFYISIPSRMISAYHQRTTRDKMHNLFKMADHLSNEQKSRMLWYLFNKSDAHFSQQEPMPLDHHTANISLSFLKDYRAEWVQFASAPGLQNAVNRVIQEKNTTPDHVEQAHFMRTFLYNK